METPKPAPPVTAPLPKNWIRWTAVALAALGWFISLDLLLVSAGGKAFNPLLQNSCGSATTGGGALDCASVLNSRWAYVGRTEKSAGTPVSAFGMGYFAFVGLWYLFVGPPTRDRFAWHFIVAVVVLFGALVSYILVRAMGVELRQWCPWCLATHAANAGLVLLTVLAFPWRAAAAGARRHPSPTLALATLCACGLAFIVHLATTQLAMASGGVMQLQNAYRGIIDDPDFAVWNYNRQPLWTIPPRDDEVYQGNPDSPNTVVIFADFQCGACKIASDILGALLAEHPDRFRVTYRHYPKDATCNPYETSRGHVFACRAAQAVEAARRVGGPEKYTEMRKLLYERQTQFGAGRFEDWATRELGLQASAFNEAFASDAVKQRIAEDISLGGSIDVTAVPALFLNGRRVEHWRNPAIWKALLGIEAAERTPDSEP